MQTLNHRSTAWTRLAKTRGMSCAMTLAVAVGVLSAFGCSQRTGQDDTMAHGAAQAEEVAVDDGRQHERVQKPGDDGDDGSAMAKVQPEVDPTSDPESVQQKKAPPVPERIIDVAPGVTAYPDRAMVTVEAITCIQAGWLEQVVCAVGTREHESLLMVEAKPSVVHAALLMAGFESGTPGTWRLDDDDEYQFDAPTGDALSIFVRMTDASGAVQEFPIADWIQDHRGEKTFPDIGWVFGGSTFVTLEEGEPERYVADMTGSIVGLVTFGDEVIGYATVLSDEEAVHAPEWEVNPAVMPVPGTRVLLVLRARGAVTGAGASDQ